LPFSYKINAWTFTNIDTKVGGGVEEVAHCAVDVERPDFEHGDVMKELGETVFHLLQEMSLFGVCHCSRIASCCQT
jgi:hypothetical protein